MIYLYIILLTIALVGITISIGMVFNNKNKKVAGFDFVRNMLPNADCKKCHMKTCDEFAKSVLAGKSDLHDCPFIREDDVDRYNKNFKEFVVINKRFEAFVACKGGCQAEDSYKYDGEDSCASENMLSGGRKKCKYACLGHGDCAEICPEHAIVINSKGTAEIIRERCTGCGKCVRVCPKHLISLMPGSRTVSPVCAYNGKENVNELCAVGCTHCGVCIRNCPVNAIYEENGKILVDETKCIRCDTCVKVCPNHVISRL
ncbi:MAG: 4Fe-4S binding protein [Clostridia bacterium]